MDLNVLQKTCVQFILSNLFITFDDFKRIFTYPSKKYNWIQYNRKSSDIFVLSHLFFPGKIDGFLTDIYSDKIRNYFHPGILLSLAIQNIFRVFKDNVYGWGQCRNLDSFSYFKMAIVSILIYEIIINKKHYYAKCVARITQDKFNAQQ